MSGVRGTLTNRSSSLAQSSTGDPSLTEWLSLRGFAAAKSDGLNRSLSDILLKHSDSSSSRLTSSSRSFCAGSLPLSIK
jgi:hypothetical protein